MRIWPFFVPFCALLLAGIVGAQGAAPAADPYEQDFQQRAKFIITKRAQDDPVEIMNWALRVNLGDPHKYALGPIIARLALDPKDAKALEAYRMLMEVDKGKADRGLYHFAAYQRARLYFQFKDTLPKDILDSNVYDVKNWFRILCGGGTENHHFMQRCNGALFAEEVAGPYPGSKPDQNGEMLRAWLRDQVRKFYTAGQGEYDSSTYVAFTEASFANIYDFSKDPQMRDLARAALEWLAAAQAAKSFHGCNAGPEARGFANSAVTTITDWCNWLWWGDSARPITEAEPYKKVGEHAAVNLALSGFRPHPVIRNLATKNVRLPYEARGSKPSYYGAQDNKDQEYLYINKEYAMTTLYSPEDGVATTGTILPQTTMFKAVVRDADNVRVFGMANGYHGHFPLEGRSPYDQYHQQRDAAIDICYVNKPEDDRTKHRSILGVPPGVGEPTVKDGWYFWQVNHAYVAARPLNGQAAFGQVLENDTTGYRWLISPGQLGGWVMQLGQDSEYPTLDVFIGEVLRRCVLDTTDFEKTHLVQFHSLQGDTLLMRHTGGPGGRPEAWTNGEKLDFTNWPVFDSPYMHEGAKSGILTVNDGRDYLTIDFRGQWPAFYEGQMP